MTSKKTAKSKTGSKKLKAPPTPPTPDEIDIGLHRLGAFFAGMLEGFLASKPKPESKPDPAKTELIRRAAFPVRSHDLGVDPFRCMPPPDGPLSDAFRTEIDTLREELSNTRIRHDIALKALNAIADKTHRSGGAVEMTALNAFNDMQRVPIISTHPLTWKDK